MAIVEYIKRDFVPRVDLTTLGNTYNTLEQGHQEAVKTASDLKTTIAALDMNEAEDGWKQAKIAEIENTVDNNTLYGNSYASLDNLIEQVGDITSDQGTIGRLRAQQNYKAFQDNIDKRTDLPDDYKEYYKEKNPYYYRDTIDVNTGKVIGSSTWKPTKTPSTVIPLNELMDKALKWAAPDVGGYTQTRWLDANGNPTANYNESVTGEYFDSTTGTWKKLTKEKLADGLQAAINATPGAKESLAQDYKIARWKYDKDGSNTDILNKEGRILSESEYLQKRINPFFDAAAYSHYTSRVSYGDAIKAQLEFNAKKALDTAGYNPADITVTSSNPIAIKNTAPIEAQAAINTSKQTIYELFNKEIVIDNLSNEQILNLANDYNLNSTQKLQLRNALDTMNENKEYIESLRAGMGKDDRLKFDTYNNIMSFSPTGNDKYGQRWQQFINDFYDGKDAIRQYAVDDDYIDEFYTLIGGRNKAIELGIKEGAKDGKRYLELPANRSSSLYTFAKAAKGAYDNTHGFFGEIWNNVKNTFSVTAGDNIMRVDANGDESPIIRIGASDTGRSMSNHAGIGYNRLINFVDDLQTDIDNLNYSKEVAISNPVVAAASPRVASAIIKRRRDPENASKYTQELNDAKTEVETILRNVDLVQSGAYEVQDNNIFEQIDTQTRKELTSKLRSYKYDENAPVAMQDPATGRWGIQVTMNYKEDDKDKQRTIFIPNVGDDILYSSWNNNSHFIAKNDVNRMGALGQPIVVASANKFGLPNSIKLISKGDGFEVREGTNTLGVIDHETAVDLRDYYLQWNMVINALASGKTVNTELAKQAALNMAEQLDMITGGNGTTTNYYYENLIKALQ